MKTPTRKRAGPSRLLAFVTLTLLLGGALVTPALAQGGDHGACGDGYWIKADFNGGWTWEDGPAWEGDAPDRPTLEVLTYKDGDPNEPWEVRWTSKVPVASVTTKAADYYTAFSGGTSGTVTGAGENQHAISHIVFCYPAPAPEPEVGGLTVTKTVVGDEAPSDAVFGFTVGEESFTLADGDTRTFTDLEAGTEVVVTETDAAGADLTTVDGVAGASTTVTIVADQTVTVAFVNSYDDAPSDPDPATITVTKSVTGDGEAPTAPFSFELTCEGETLQRFDVAAGETSEVFTVPAEAICSVEETAAHGAEVTWSISALRGQGPVTASFTVEPETRHEVLFTNHFPADDDNGNGNGPPPPPPPPPPPVLEPGIDLVKAADLTPDEEGDKVVTFEPDGAPVTITYDYLVTNTGDTTLSEITLVDDPLGPITVTTDALDPGETATGTIDYVVTAQDADAGEIYNEAEVTGQAPDGTIVEATDDELVHVETVLPIEVPAEPGISLEKVSDVQPDDDGVKALVFDPDAAPMTITYTYTITNTGDTTLSDLTLLDDVLGPISVPDVTLEPGDELEVLADHVMTEADAEAGEILNVAVVTGTAPGDVQVTDTASELVHVVRVLEEAPEPTEPDTREPVPTVPTPVDPPSAIDAPETPETEVKGVQLEKETEAAEAEVLDRALPRTGVDGGALAMLAAAMMLAGSVLLRTGRPHHGRARR
jgi:hypothetical protein